ncbi:poly-gamma-glutamate hydrolase family protein [Priestia sp. OVL9]|nr:poly-gamma-glutamate hydrolase family protein [Priestia sp. OVL9]
MCCFLILPPSYASGDYYSSYAELQQHEILHQDYDIRYEQRFSYLSIMAIHGGGIEPVHQKSPKNSPIIFPLLTIYSKASNQLTTEFCT